MLGDPVRRRIPELLADEAHTSGEVVAVIQREFGVTQAVISRHLKLLRDSGFARVRVNGARRICAMDAEPLKDIDAWLQRFRLFREPKLKALAAEIERGERNQR